MSGRLSSSPTSRTAAALTPSRTTVTEPQGTNVQVAVRCRPLNAREKASCRAAIVQCRANSNEIAIVKRKTYGFDKVYSQYATQKDVFKSTVKPVVDEALAGYNCTVFAYGQTGTGKTYTMQGALSPDDEMAGIIPRSVRYIFDSLQASNQEFSIKVSFLQLYNEELKDLLVPNETKKLRLMEDAKRGGIYCQNLLEVTTTTAEHVFDLLATGVKNRITSETLMNENSSRSHSIFTIRIHCKENSSANEELLKIGQLNLVDLAGSECVGKSGARNARAREAGSINQSLLTLGRVITALVDNHPHIPYRDSKLTRLLQESLGGRAKTTIIATLAPCADSLDETLSTLEYAYRAKSIKNKPEVNQKMTKAGLLKEYGSEIESLRQALQAARQKDGIYLPPSQFAEMEERIAGQAVQICELEDELDARNKICKEFEEQVEKQEEEIAAFESIRKDLEGKLSFTEAELASTKEALKATESELAQTRAVLEAYKQNEQVLLLNGAKATKWLQESEAREQTLHDKIVRQWKVEQTNGELATSYSEKSTTQIQAFQDRLTSHKQQQDERFSDVVTSLNELYRVHSTDLDGLLKSLANLQTLMETNKAESDAQYKLETSLKDAQRDESKKILQEQETTLQCQLEKFVQMSQDHAAIISEDLSAAKERCETFLRQMHVKLEGSREDVGNFLAEQSKKLVELQTSLSSAFDEQKIQLQATEELLEAALRDSHEQKQKDLHTIKTQLSEFVDKCIAKESEQLLEHTQLIKETKLGLQKQLASAQTIADKEIKGSVETLIEQQAKHHTDSSEVEERMKQIVAEVDETSSKHVVLVEKQLSERAGWSSSTTTLWANQAAAVSNLLEQHQQADYAALKKRQASNASLVSDHEQLRGILTNGCTTLMEGLQSNLTTTKQQLDTAAKTAQEVIEESTTATTQQREAIETYMKQRMFINPTGATPLKKKFTFPVFEATKLDDIVVTAQHVGRKRSLSEISKASNTPHTAPDTEDTTDNTEANEEGSQVSTTSTSCVSEESVPTKSEDISEEASSESVVAMSKRPNAAKAKSTITTTSGVPKKKMLHQSHRNVPHVGMNKTGSAPALKRFRPLGESTNFR